MQKLTKLFLLYFALLAVYAVFSFSLTDPNLVFTSWQPFLFFQNFMWQTFFHNATLLTVTYIILITSLFAVYAAIVIHTKKSKQTIGLKQILLYILLISPLFLSYNALSHDVFNYMFNAKMITVYEQNPHISTALDFPNDPWVRFMHNVHTPAPYGYGWTAFSLIPYKLGFGKFVSTWFIFRMLSVVSIIALFFSTKYLANQLKVTLSFFTLALVFLNPLLIIEVVSNMHNDLWMMVPAMLALGMMLKRRKTLNLVFILISMGLLMFSISTKMATLVLVPIWIGLLFFQYITFKKLKPYKEKFNYWWPTLASILLFIPLLTSRSQQFHPWYLLWVMVWIPFIKISLWKRTILVFSAASLFRYVPWLLAGGFETQTLFYQKLITWVVPSVYFIWQLITQRQTLLKELRK